MNDLLQSLRTEFQDEEYRYAYAQSFLNTKLASQIKTLREQRGMTQARAAAKMNIKQPGYRRFEDVNHEVWRTDSLWSIARAYGVRLDISFKTFGTLPEDKKNLKKENLQLPEFDDDPAFKESSTEPEAAIAALPGLSWLGNSSEAAAEVVAKSGYYPTGLEHLTSEVSNQIADAQQYVVNRIKHYKGSFGLGESVTEKTTVIDTADVRPEKVIPIDSILGFKSILRTLENINRRPPQNTINSVEFRTEYDTERTGS